MLICSFMPLFMRFPQTLINKRMNDNQSNILLQLNNFQSREVAIESFNRYIKTLDLSPKTELRERHIHEYWSKLYPPKLASQRLADAQLKEIIPYAYGFQYALTLQTRMRPCADKGKLSDKIALLGTNFRHFSNRLNSLVYKMSYKRDPDNSRLLLVPILEGLGFSPNSGKTLHYHVGIGNVPNSIDEATLLKLIRKAWLKVSFARNDIDLQPSDPWWIFYSKKEAIKGHEISIDWANVTAPIRIFQS